MARVCPVCGAAEADCSGCLAQFLALLDTPVPPPDPKHASVRNYTPTEALNLARRGFEERQRVIFLAKKAANMLVRENNETPTPIKTPDQWAEELTKP